MWVCVVLVLYCDVVVLCDVCCGVRYVCVFGVRFLVCGEYVFVLCMCCVYVCVF